MVFVGSYSTVLGPVASTMAWVAGLLLVIAALFAHYVRPVALGPLARPRPLALATYGACVVGELALISVGSRALAAAGQAELRPALIAAVVGLHFLPLAWAFGEPMFYYLGGAVALLGGAGLLAGALGVEHSAEALTVVAGLVMLTIITLYQHRELTVPAAAVLMSTAHSRTIVGIRTRSPRAKTPVPLPACQSGGGSLGDRCCGDRQPPVRVRRGR
ncbi:MAG: hypothetical protein H7233_01450 [Pseudorhodobacter sp.]|nr:hypothetical protein [Frankiaceae bacterium]